MDPRTEIREFLATRRAKITPDQAGMPLYGGRRRVPGLPPLPAARENGWAAACIMRAEGRRPGDTSALTESARRREHIGARFERDCTLQLLADST